MGIAPKKMAKSKKPAREGNTKPWGAKSAPKAAVGKKETRYYPAEDVKKKLGNHHNTTKLTKLRKNIVPGSVLILLAGHFKGQRVVFLKQLDSGLLLTGPYKLNGVPLRRVPQSYVIGTSTVVDVSGADTSAVNDALFKKPKSAKKKADGPFSEDEAKKPLDDAAKALQAKVDGGVKLDDDLKGYLKSKFGLSRADVPHEMSF